MADTPSFCRQCAERGPTCCQRAEIYVTPGDIERIAAAVGDRDFFVNAVPAGDGRPRDAELDPAWSRIFRPDGSRRVLRRMGGACLFLGDDGCRLAMDVRPLLCRLYPFDYNATALKGVHAHLCPRPERDNAPLLMALLCMNRDEAETWRRQFYEEMAEEE